MAAQLPHASRRSEQVCHQVSVQVGRKVVYPWLSSGEGPELCMLLGSRSRSASFSLRLVPILCLCCLFHIVCFLSTFFFFCLFLNVPLSFCFLILPLSLSLFFHSLSVCQSLTHKWNSNVEYLACVFLAKTPSPVSHLITDFQSTCDIIQAGSSGR